MSTLLTLFTSIRWQDIVDILLVSYIVFRLYILLRGTTVFHVLIGIALLWLSHRIALFLGLIVTSWAMQGIMAVTALIIIVVFRNEIRSVLQAKNARALLWGFGRKEPETPVDIIAESVYELARSHTGALIVLPGMEDVEELIHSGIPWGGAVSKEMLLSIFWHDNPVHDGAAVIKGDRVEEVGVILPLSHRKDLPSSYGTRHRAAAGLAEKTDALIVLVSEERGEVAVAQGSRMRTIKQKDHLMRILREHAEIPGQNKGYLKRQRLELGLAALASILFITGVWFSFARGWDTLTTLEVPLGFINRDSETEVVDTSANSVRLELSGSSTLMRSLRPEQVNVRIDLSKAGVGPNTVPITKESIALPPGISLKKVEPTSVTVSLDTVITKDVPVQVYWVGMLPDDLRLAEVRLEPEMIKVIGGKEVLESVSTIYTEPVSLDNLEPSGTTTVRLALNPASLRIASGSKDKVTVKYVTKQRLP
jgi:diadenylate cyclase